MKKKKLELGQLKVKSFVIPLDRSAHVRGAAVKTSEATDKDGPVSIGSETRVTENFYCTFPYFCNETNLLQLCKM